MSLITLDFETFYSKEFSLSKMTTESYIRSPEFETIGVAVKVDDGVPKWFSGTYEQTKEFLESYDIPSHSLLCHNMMFDGAILSWKYGIRPQYYFDTLAMAKPITGQTVGGSLAALAKKFNLPPEVNILSLGASEINGSEISVSRPSQLAVFIIPTGKE